MPLRHPFDGQWADPDAAQPVYGDAHRVHHPPDDVLNPDVEHHLQDDALTGFPQQPELVRHDQDVIDEDAVKDALHRAVVRPRRRDDVVLLGQAVPRVHDPVR